MSTDCDSTRADRPSVNAHGGRAAHAGSAAAQAARRYRWTRRGMLRRAAPASAAWRDAGGPLRRPLIAAELTRLKAPALPATDTGAFSTRSWRPCPAGAAPPGRDGAQRPGIEMNACQQRPVVYSCSGCSSAAQLANAVALKLDRAGIAEMSCIAGVGGDVPSLLSTAKSGRPIVALDGCALACVRSSLARHELSPALYFDLSEQGVRRLQHVDFDSVQAQRVFRAVAQQIARALPTRAEAESALMRPRLSAGVCS